MSKTEQLRQHLERGDDHAALMLAKGFKLGLSKEERSVIARAAECRHSPEFYRQLGFDPDECVARGVALLRARFGRRE